MPGCFDDTEEPAITVMIGAAENTTMSVASTVRSGDGADRADEVGGAGTGRYGITTNAVIPGLINTALTWHEDRYAQAIIVGGREPSGDLASDEGTAKKLLAARSPLGVPWIDSADVASVVAFLASGEARMLSGASFAVTAGDSANVTA